VVAGSSPAFLPDLENNIDRQIFILYKELINKELLTKTIFKILEEEKFGN
jgi:hypothetical protein